MQNVHKVYNLIILDESGSMQSIKASVISGFNEIVQTIVGAEQQHSEQEHFISLVSFNGLGIKTILDKEKPAQLKTLDANTYRPDASTPLYDAMGLAINHLRATIDPQTTHNVLVTVITDGEENASKEYTGKAIKALVEELKQKQWTFTYIGANQDVEQVAKSLSIENKLAFNSNVEETRQMFAQESAHRKVFYSRLASKKDVSKGYFDDETDEKS